eukprot:1628259-Amphidinium_carterae.1
MWSSRRDDDATPPHVKLHGLLPAPRLPAIRTFELALANRAGVATVWIDGSGPPHHRRCGVGCYTDTQERVFFPCQESSHRCTVRNCMRLPVRLKNTNHVKWSVIAKERGPADRPQTTQREEQRSRAT